MLSRFVAVLVLLATTLVTIPAFATTTTPDTSATTMETAADPSATKLTPSDPTTPVALGDDPASHGYGLGTPQLQQEFSLAPTGSGGDIDKIDGKYLKGYFIDAGKILSSPMHWEAKDWLKAGLVLGVTSSLFLVDRNVKDYSQSHQGKAGSDFAQFGNAQGNGLFVLPALGATYLYGHLADDHKARRTALLALESYAISGLLTEGLKEVAQRHRPNTGDKNTTFDGPKLSTKNVSFSSGHTSTAFSIATVIADEYKDNAWVPPIAYGLATLTGLSRIYSNEHWSSDVFFGAALGYFVSKGVLSLHKEDKSPLLPKHLSLMPKFGTQLTGLEMKYEF